MKKLIIPFLVALSFTNITAASPYVRISSGASIFPVKSEKEEGYDYISKVRQETPAGLGEIGFGYNLSSNNRMELAFGYVVPEHTQTGYVNNFKADDGTMWRGEETIKVKATISTTMLKSYLDFVELGRFKTFFGAGVGFARIEQTIKNTCKITHKDTGLHYKESGPTRKAIANNFAYSIILGSSIALHKSVILEGAYSFMDLGKVKHNKNADYEETKTHYKSHNLALGLRFNFN